MTVFRCVLLAVDALEEGKLDDESIVVVYASVEEMAVCREATRVCGRGSKALPVTRSTAKTCLPVLWRVKP